MLRHGEAVPHESKPDFDRELTPRGRAQSEAAGRALAALNEEFDACYSSPKVRAWETAALACASLNIEPTREDSLAMFSCVTSGVDQNLTAGEKEAV